MVPGLLRVRPTKLWRDGSWEERQGLCGVGRAQFNFDWDMGCWSMRDHWFLASTFKMFKSTSVDVNVSLFGPVWV